DRRGEGQRVLSDDVTRWAEDVLKTRSIGSEEDLRRMGPCALESRVFHAEKFEVVVAQGREPGDLDGVEFRGADGHRECFHFVIVFGSGNFSSSRFAFERPPFQMSYC